MKPQLPAFCLGLIILYNITDTRAADIDGINDGIFTSQQAKSGKRLYKQYCKSCHDGTYFGPVLLAWQGEALTDLFELIRSVGLNCR